MKMNKKTLIIIAVAVVVVLAVVLALVLAGGNKTPDTTTTTTTTTTTKPADNDPVVTGDYTLGMGVAFGDHTNAQINATIAVVVLDANGVIVDCKLDAVQNKYSLDFDNETYNFTVLETKMELGDKYGMAGKVDNNGDGVMLEWYDQVYALENYLVGKTLAQVEAIETQFVNNHYIAKDEALLNAGCTIQITDFVAAVVKACKDDQSVKFSTSKDFTVGIGANSADNGTAYDDNGITVKMNVDFAATVVVDGKIVAALNDAYQPAVSIDWDKVVTSEGDQRTKREKKEDYGMAGKVDNDGNGVKLEWYLQSAAFSAHVVGMTGAEVAAMETTFVNNHYISTDKALLDAGCSMQITGIMLVVSEAVTNAR